MPSPEEQVMRIIADYHRQALTLEQAAPRLRDALKSLHRGINIGMTPSIRRLFAEAAKLDGQVWPDFEPDPNRHVMAGPAMLETLERAWAGLRRDPRIDEVFSIDFQFAATSEQTAHAIASWLREHGQREVKVCAPAESDSDDWSINACTPATRWSEALCRDWATVIREAPVGREGSFRGWSC
jgi:hypothetical protein